MKTLLTQSNAEIVWALGLAGWYAIRYPHMRRARRMKVASHKRGVGERLLLAGAGLGLSAIPAFVVVTGIPKALDYAFNPLLAVIGTVCLAASLWLFHLCHRQIGRNWSVTLEIREGHKLVTDGLYRYVRHPMYASFWLWALAQALLLPNWLAGFSGLVGVGILFFLRVGREEAMMVEAFGDEYRAYTARTARIIPGVY